MSQSRESLYGDFLPLIAAVEATSRRVDGIPDSQIDQHQGFGTLKDENSFKVKAERAAVHRMLQQARAAELILQHLRSGKGARPEWHACVNGQHFPDETVGRMGYEQLIWLSSRALPSRRNAPPPAPTDGSESTLIGFHIDEFIRFLDANGVPHTLGKPKDADLLEGGSEADTSEAGAPQANFVVAIPKPPAEPRRFNGIWAEALEMAWAQASLKDDARSTYAALCAIAKAPNPPYPILGFVNGEGVKWEDDQADDGISFFTLKNMRDRLRPRKSEGALRLEVASKTGDPRKPATERPSANPSSARKNGGRRTAER